jgi:hypothetical protein
MAIRPCTKSDCGAGRRHSARPTNGPPSAAGLQLDHATTSVLLVRPTQGFGGFVRRPMAKHLSEKQAETERIEEAVSHIHFPLTFSDQLYNPRSHIEIVRRKITSHGNAPVRVAAE